MRKKNTKFVPLSNEMLKKVILGTSIVVGGFVIATGSAYADKQDEVVNTSNVISSGTNESTLNDDREDNIELSEDTPKERVTASNEKQEVEVTDETKTPDENDKVSDIDETVIDKSGEFVGKENGQTSLSGDKDIASKEDLDKDKTVDEFNKKYREEKTKKTQESIVKEKQAKKEERLNLVTEMNNHYQSRSEEFLKNLESEFKNDIAEMRKFNADWAFVAENDVVNSDNDWTTVIF